MKFKTQYGTRNLVWGIERYTNNIDDHVRVTSETKA